MSNSQAARPHHPLVGAVARELRALRAREDLTLDQAVEVTGVSRSTLHKFERGTRSPNIDQLAAIAAGYGLTVSEVLERAEGDLSSGGLKTTDGLPLGRRGAEERQAPR